MTKPAKVPLWIAGSLLSLWLGLLATLGFWRDERALIGAFDTGLYLQLIANLARHGDFASSITGEANFLGHHFQPIVVLLTPLAALETRAFPLLALGLVAVVISLAIYAQAASRLRTGAPLLVAAVIASFCAQPSVAGRLWFGFSPEVLALPALAWMARALLQPRQVKPWTVVLAVLWVGACKETFWLTDAAVFAAYYCGRGQRWQGAAAAAMCLSVFAAVFFYWMPQHSSVPSYYGLSYYLPPPSDPAFTPGFFAIASALSQNLASVRSIQTLLTLTLLTCGLPYLGWNRCLWGAVPGLGLILLSLSPQVHHPANHYLLSVLPFLTGAAIGNLPKLLSWIRNPGARRGLAYLVILVPLTSTLFMTGGVLDACDAIVKNPQTAYRRGDASTIRAALAEQQALMVDGSLQPLFAAHRDTTVLLGSVGNPKGIPPSVLNSDAVVVTSVDLLALAGCNVEHLGGAGLRADYEAFSRLCNRVQRDGKLLAAYPDSGLFAYHLPVAAP